MRVLLSKFIAFPAKTPVLPQGFQRDGEKLIGNHHAMGKESVIFDVEKAPKQDRKQG